MLDISANVGLAVGRATATAAGAAIYEALAAKIPNIVAPPTLIPMRDPAVTPINPLKSGKKIPKAARGAPTFLISAKLLPAK